MVILPFILYGVTERVTVVTERVTDGLFLTEANKGNEGDGRARL
jgi:hypothetical protein